jgi:hypothetical protein
MEDIQDDYDQSHSNRDDEPGSHLANQVIETRNRTEQVDLMAQGGESSLQKRRGSDVVGNCSEVETVLNLSAGGFPSTNLHLNTVPTESDFHESIDTARVSGNSRDLDANHELHSATLLPPLVSDYMTSTPQLIESVATRFSSNCEVRDDLSLREHQYLLKYYIDNVAPWVCSI